MITIVDWVNGPASWAEAAVVVLLLAGGLGLLLGVTSWRRARRVIRQARRDEQARPAGEFARKHGVIVELRRKPGGRAHD